MSLPQAIMMMIPEAWQQQKDISAEKKAFYEWSACLMEPWDGPALFTFSDGRFVGASLDRNGLRPCRYYLTNSDTMICASEVGAVMVDPATITHKGRLHPGRMLLVDTLEGRLVDDVELKRAICVEHPYAEWISKYMIRMNDLNLMCMNDGLVHVTDQIDHGPIHKDKRMICFGFSLEQLLMIIAPMVNLLLIHNQLS